MLSDEQPPARSKRHDPSTDSAGKPRRADARARRVRLQSSRDERPASPDQRRAMRDPDELYRSLFNSIDEGFCVVEMIFDEQGGPADYRFVETNPAFDHQTGLVAAAGRRMREMVPDHEQHWFDIYGKVALTGESIRFENAARGLNRWFSVYAFRVGNAESRRVAILFTDITERRRAEQRTEFLAVLSHKLASATTEQEIIRVAIEAVCTQLNADRCYFVECLERENRVIAGRNWLRGETPSIEGKYDLSDFGGIEWWRQFSSGNFAVEDITTHPLTADKVATYLTLGIRSYAVQPFRRDGAWTVALAVTETAPRKWREDELRIIDDVAARVWPMVERARADRALRETLELRVAERTAKLQETISDLESFSYSISHDLRAPLRAMQSFAAILAGEYGGNLGSEGREYIRRIVNAGERMDRLIQDVLVYSRVARNAMPLERIELGTFITGILESYPHFGTAHARIEVTLPLAPVCANATALTQCVSNLMGNAIKFVAPGVKPHVRIWTEVAPGDRVRVFFADNGIGIAPQAKEKIFEIFYQADPRHAGTGIGLAVVRKAVQRMGGTITVESEPGKGSTFCLELNSPEST